SNPHSPQRPGDFKSPVSTIPPFLHQEPCWRSDCKVSYFFGVDQIFLVKKEALPSAGLPFLPHKRQSLA
ncbi:MAG: hypothetical protein K2L22_01300, partial [Muribaculaceae bacterium]|nr:hypothetical protein [Muribaculaceae bacterium]